MVLERSATEDEEELDDVARESLTSRVARLEENRDAALRDQERMETKLDSLDVKFSEFMEEFRATHQSTVGYFDRWKSRTHIIAGSVGAGGGIIILEIIRILRML